MLSDQLTHKSESKSIRNRGATQQHQPTPTLTPVPICTTALPLIATALAAALATAPATAPEVPDGVTDAAIKAATDPSCTAAIETNGIDVRPPCTLERDSCDSQKPKSEITIVFILSSPKNYLE
jgi:hypothetical protein